jgi:methylmalonyl-CoA mutase
MLPDFDDAPMPEFSARAETWQTPEGIVIKSAYSLVDLAGVEHLGSLPGFAPFVRGVYPSM